MKLHFRIPWGLKAHFENELTMARKQFNAGNFQVSWRHLERAHILGQSWPVQHTKAHWCMIVFAFKVKKTKEILGQIPRLLMGGVKSFVGEVPLGNSGGANVPPLRLMEIPDDILQILNRYQS